MKITRALTCGLQAFITICMVAVLVAACGGGGGSGSGASSTAITSITATPMKGQFCAGAQVTAYDINNVAVGSAFVSSSGVANLTIPANTAFPLHLTAGAGSNGSCYWDEALGNFVSIPPQTTILNAAISSLHATASGVGITVFTELAFQNATSGVPVTSLTASNVQAANTLVAELFGLAASGVADALRPPTLIGQNTPKITSITAPGDVYALAVAAMAKLSATTMPGSTPAQVAAQWLNNAKANPASGVSGLPEAQGWGAAWTAVTTGASSVLAAGVPAPQPSSLSSSPLIGPTITFNSLNNYVATHGFNGSFVISGWAGAPSSPASGSGIMTTGPTILRSLNGAAALQRVDTITGQLSSAYGTSSLGGTVTTFLDPATYAEKIISTTDSYTEFPPFSYPATIRAGDSVTLITSNEYLDSSKTTLLGTERYSYAVAPDTASSLLLTFITDWYNTSNAHTYQEQDTFRVALDGSVTPVSARIITYAVAGAVPSDLTMTFSSVALTTNTPKFAYVTNSYANSISTYSIDASTGTLTQITGSPVTTGDVPISVAVDPLGRFVYVANMISGDISAYTINRSTGALNTVSGSPFLAGLTPRSITVDPSGRFVYVANLGSGNISAYTINTDTGALTEITGSPFGTGINAWASGPYCITVDPLGKFAYVADDMFDIIEVLSINTNTGGLSAVVPGVTSGGSILSRPTSIAIDPTGRFAYLADQGLSNINTYTINPDTGVLTEVPNSQLHAMIGGSTSVAVDPSGKFVYMSNQSGLDINGNISAFTINTSTGAPTQISGSPFTSGLNPIFIAVDPSGKFVYATNASNNTISGYSIDIVTGALTALNGSPFTTGESPTSIAFSK